jgi:GNAT superfamily N-acetyltransferase
MMAFKHYAGATLPVGASLAQSNRLYVPGWTLSTLYADFKDGFRAEGSQLVIASKDGTPIAAALFYGRDHQVMAFTRQAFRRQGLAVQCIKRLKALPENVVAGEGIDGTLEFWQKAGIPAYARDYDFWPRGGRFE